MRSLWKQPLFRVLLIATTVAVCSMAVRETASITLPIIKALKEVLIPVALGFTIAYIVTPLVDWVTNRLRVPRTISAGMFFGVFCTIAVLLVVLLVPTVVRQSTSMAERVFKGEQYSDINENGVYDEGENYVDANDNNRYDDTGMLAGALAWVEERQGQLRQFAQLEIDRPAKSFLLLYLDDTRPERVLIEQALKVAGDNTPVEQWQAALRQEPSADAPLSWNDKWPGASRAEIDDAYNRIVPEARERWIRNVSSAGQRYAIKHHDLLTALRMVRREIAAMENDPLVPLIDRVRQALQQKPGEEREKQARTAAEKFSVLERDNQFAARELMNALRGRDTSAQWLAPVVQKLESEVNTQLEVLPARLGNWATSGLTSVDAVLSFALDVILVPIYTFFLILAMPAIRRGAKDYLPNWHRAQLIRILHDIERVVAAFFRGRLIVCFICSVLIYIGFLAVGISGTGVPYAVLFSLLIGLATAVPLAGLLFLVPAIIMTGLDGGSAVTIALIIIVYTIVQVMETVVLTPTIMGREVELHPVTLIIALLLCGKLLGILGLILAVPIAATVRIVAREFFFPWWTGYVTKIHVAPKQPFHDA
jgi:predicted PurR-regulated permease PerM